MNVLKEFSIQPATPGSVGILADLSTRTFFSAYQSMLPEDALQEFVRSAFSQDKIQEEMDLPGSQFLLAYEGKKPVGYAFLRIAGPPAGLTGSRPIELARIYLVEDVTGMGYGTKLMDACLDLASQAGHETLWLGVWERNERAIRFYEKMGFVRVGTLPFVFSDDLHTDLVMVRSLSKE